MARLFVLVESTAMTRFGAHRDSLLSTDLIPEVFYGLGEAFTGEALFECLNDVVYFIKNERVEYVVVNRT